MKHLQHQPNQSKSNLSRQAPLSQQEADEKVISQQANQTLWLFHNRQDQTLLLFFVAVPLVIPQCIKSQSCTEDGKWKYSLTHYPTTTTNKYPLVRFRCINVKMTREFGWDGITRWQESYSTSPLPPSCLVVLITSKRGKPISAGTLANSGGLLCGFNLLRVVVASDFGNYQHQRLLIPSSLF